MNPRLRDGLLALATAAALVGLALTAGVPLAALGRPVPLVAGAVGTIGIELLLARVPARTRRVWNRPVVQAGAVAGTVGTGVGAVWLSSAEIVLAVLLGGLGAYLLLLAGVAAGAVAPPPTWGRG